MKYLAPATDDSAPPGLQQHPAYLRAVTRMGGSGHVVTLPGAARAQVITRRIGPLALNWIARGPLWETTRNKHAALTAIVARLPGCTLAVPETIEQTPLFRACGFSPVMTSQFVAEIDLTQPQDTRLGAQHGKWRNRLRRAQAQGLTICDSRFDPARHSGLLDLETAQRRTRRYTALPRAFTLGWATANPGSARLFHVSDRSGVQAFMLVLLHQPAATYHIGWSGPQGRQLCAHNLLLWQASNWLAGRGYSRFDLGLVDTDQSPGLARFKISAGAQVRPLGPTMLRLPELCRRIYRAA